VGAWGRGGALEAVEALDAMEAAEALEAGADLNGGNPSDAGGALLARKRIRMDEWRRG
jgi:hypothetical protein